MPPYAASHASAGGGAGAAGWPGHSPAPRTDPAPATPPASGSDRPGGSGHEAGTLHTQMPPIPSSFPALQHMKLAELMVLEADDITRAAFVNGQDTVRLFRDMLKGLKQENLAACLANAGKEDGLRQKREEAEARRAAVARLEDTARAMEERKRSIEARFVPAALQSQLEGAAEAADTDSLQAEDAFVGGEGAPALGAGPARTRWLTAALDAYIAQRSKHHSLTTPTSCRSTLCWSPPCGRVKSPA